MRYFLLITCVLLLGLIFYQIKFYPGNDLMLTDTNSTSEISSEDARDFDSQLNSIQAYSSIIERPLFSSNRKPPLIASQHSANSISAAELDDLVLFGVVVSQELTYALIKDNNSGETEQITKDRQYRGWTVSEITSESIKFEADNAQYELFLTPNESTKKNGVRSNRASSQNVERSRAEGNKKPAERTVIKSYKSIFRSSQKKSSPIKLPSDSSKAKSTPNLPELSDAELEKLHEEGGYEYNPDDDEFDVDVDDFDLDDVGFEE